MQSENVQMYSSFMHLKFLFPSARIIIEYLEIIIEEQKEETQR